MSMRLPKPRTVALSLATLVVVWLLFAWLALPRIVHSQAVNFIAEKTGHQLTLDRPEFNPFAWRLRLANLRLNDPQGQPLLAFRGLEIDLSAASLTQRALVFDGIRLDAPAAWVVLGGEHADGGKHNWSPLFSALSATPQEDEEDDSEIELPRIDIRQFALNEGSLDFNDADNGFATRIEPLDFELADLSTLPRKGEAPGLYTVEAHTAHGAHVRWQGALNLQRNAQVEAHGKLSLDSLDLSRLAPLLQDVLPTPPAGTFAIATEYRAAYAAGQFDLQLENIAAQLAGLQLKPLAQGPQIDVQNIAAKNGHFDLASQQAKLDALTLDGITVQLPAGEPLRVTQLQLNQAQLDLAAHQASLAQVLLQGGQIKLQRDAQGQLDLLAAIDTLQSATKSTASSGSAPEKTAPPSPTRAEPTDADADTDTEADTEAAWQFALDELTLAGLELQFSDASVKPKAELALQDVHLQLEKLSSDLSQPVPLQARLRVREGGSLEASGELTPATTAARVKFKLANLALQPAQPWLNEFVKLRLTSGTLNVNGELLNQAGKDGVSGATSTVAPSFKGGFALNNLRLLETEGGAPFLSWRQLSTSNLSASTQRLDIGTLLLDGLDTKLLIAEDKSTNINQILKQSPEADADSAAGEANDASDANNAGDAAQAAATDASQAAPASPAFPINLTRLRVRNGKLEFADRSLALPFGTRIHHLQGSINGLTTRPGAAGRIELDGQIDEYGLARVTGQIDLAQPTQNTDVKVVFRNVDMRSLTPYSATFAGRKIDAGKLSLDLAYTIKQRQLVGENQVIMDQLTLGETVDSPEAKNLPLDLAIAILQDGDGRIDLGLPVAGSLDDPQFSYGSIILKAILNVFSKIATAPFRMLGSLLGGSDKQFESIGFEPGAQNLTPPEREKLMQLAEALNKRPNLTLTLHASYAEADRVALQQRQLTRVIMRQAGQQALKEGEDPGPLTADNPLIQEILEKLYADRLGSGELAALKAGFRQANPGALEESAGDKMLSRLGSLLREQRELSDAEVAALKGGHFHQILFDQLRMREEVADKRLQDLAATRGKKALEMLLETGLGSERIRLGAEEKLEDESADIKEIPLRLDLGAQTVNPQESTSSQTATTPVTDQPAAPAQPASEASGASDASDTSDTSDN